MNKKVAFIIVGIIILAIGGYFIFSLTSSSNSKADPLIVLIQGSEFSPSEITITKDNFVTWQNNDSYSHRIVADDGSFDLGDQSSGVKLSLKFDEVGVFDYHCSIHRNMVGRVIVR